MLNLRVMGYWNTCCLLYFNTHLSRCMHEGLGRPFSPSLSYHLVDPALYQILLRYCCLNGQTQNLTRSQLRVSCSSFQCHFPYPPFFCFFFLLNINFSTSNIALVLMSLECLPWPGRWFHTESDVGTPNWIMSSISGISAPFTYLLSKWTN